MSKSGKPRKNSRAKGKSFERVVAKQHLTIWWGEEFHSTPASGGLHWKKDNRVTGDIVPPDGSDFPFSVECKKREGWNFEQILKNVGEPKDWWDQCVEDAERVDKIPLLIFSKNRSPIYYCIPASFWSRLFIGGNYFLTMFGEWEVAIGELENLMKVTKEKVLEEVNHWKN